MRLREIKQILDENIEQLNVDHTADLGGAKYEIKNFHELYDSIRSIEKLSFIKEEIAELDQLGTVFHDKSNRVIVDNNVLNKLRGIINTIAIKVEAVILAISEALPEQDQNSVSIKLPNYTELTKVSAFIKEIDIILNQTLIDDFKSKIKLQNFDTGSNWIEIILENKDAIIFLGGLISCTYKFIQDSYLQWKQTEHTIKVLKTDEKAKELILNSLEDNIKMQAQLHASALMKDFNISESHQEYHTNLSHSIQKLASLISEGTEIHTALNAPEETKQAFPDKTTHSLIGNATKLLSDSDSTSDGSVEK